MLRFIGFCLAAGACIFLAVFLISQPLWPTPKEASEKIASQKQREPRLGNDNTAAGPVGELGLNPGVVVRDCRFTSIEKQDVPSQREGTLVIAGVELPAGPDGSPPAGYDVAVDWQDIWIMNSGPEIGMRLLAPREDFDPEKSKIEIRKTKRYFSRLSQGASVRKDQVVAIMDPKLALSEMDLKLSKMSAVSSERDSASKMILEAEATFRAQENLRLKNAGSEEEWRRAKLGVDRYKYDFQTKANETKIARTELLKARTELSLLEVRTAIDGTVRTINKFPGESLRPGETLLDIQNLDKLRVEGFVEVQQASELQNGDTVQIEPTRPVSPALVLSGHLLEVTGVAVSPFPGSSAQGLAKSLVVSCSEDKTVRLWEATQSVVGARSVWGGRQLDARRFNDPLRCVAVSPIQNVGGVEGLWIVSGSGSGKLTVGWIVADGKGGLKVEDLKEIAGHRNALEAVAFSPDGKFLATGGQDSTLHLWQMPVRGADAKIVNTINEAHKAEITQVAFAKTAEGQLRLISASSDKDRTLGVWTLEGAPTAPKLAHKADFVRRGGDVSMPGISPDGSTVLLDQGNQIKMVAIGDRQPRGVIENLSGALNFTTMAIFSPDSEMILTNCSEENRLQLWRAPTKGGRAAELRQFVWAGEGEGTCGAFDPQRRFAVTGTGDHQVLIWELPDQKEVNTILTGRVELVSQFIDSSSPQRLFRAKLDGRNPGYLLPGGTATIVKPAVTAGTQPVVGKITP